MAELRYIHLGTGSEHVEKWSNKGWLASRGRKCQRKESIVQELGFSGNFYISSVKFS
jgi:hypothetical protein